MLKCLTVGISHMQLVLDLLLQKIKLTTFNIFEHCTTDCITDILHSFKEHLSIFILKLLINQTDKIN